MHLSIESEAQLTQQTMKALSKATEEGTTVWLTHANWCGHCQAFSSEWKKFRETHGKKINVVDVESSAIEKIKQDQKLYKKITKKEGNQHILYFPMIVVFYKKGDKTVKKHFEGERTSDKLHEFLEAHKAVKPKAVKPAKKGGNTKKTENIQEVESRVQKIIEKFFKL
jgi:thiol-disulfide isomerase/thioredoxin